MLCRPHAECGAGAGEAVSGGEADCPGGAEENVREGAGVATATTLAREDKAAPPAQQQRAPGLHHAQPPQQATSVDRRQVGHTDTPKPNTWKHEVKLSNIKDSTPCTQIYIITPFLILQFSLLIFNYHG